MLNQAFYNVLILQYYSIGKIKLLSQVGSVGEDQSPLLRQVMTPPSLFSSVHETVAVVFSR